jgi:nitroreductase
MDISDVISQRKSTRAFKPEPVPKGIIKEIIEMSLRSPSWANTQPWEFAVVGGKTAEEIRKACEEKAMSGAPMNPDIAPPAGFPEPFDSRRRAVGKKMFDVLGFGRDDKEKRLQWGLRGFKLFDAPNVIYILTDRSFYSQDARMNVWPLFDCGLVAQNIMLLAVKHGLGTIPEIQAVAYPDVLRKILSIPDSKLIVLGIALGYPDQDHPISQLRSEREPVDGVTLWYGFH